MGDVADAIINGEICEECTMPLAAPTGYPTKCAACSPTKRRKRKKKKPSPSKM
jgi:hypothetical protein